MGRICLLFGITRQAYYQHYWQVEQLCWEEELLLQQVRFLRQTHPRMGTRKLYVLLEEFMLEHQIKLGRDALFDLLAAHQLLVYRRKRKIVTTDSHHWLHKYTNLIKDKMAQRPNQIWVSDITYWKIAGRHCYISLVTDAFSHQIVGYHLAESLQATESVKALQMAINQWKPDQTIQTQTIQTQTIQTQTIQTQTIQTQTIQTQAQMTTLIHHSDRGVQYCSEEYVGVLTENKIAISMGEKGDPLENAIAERINGILKNEYLYPYSQAESVSSFQQAQHLLEKAVGAYNQQRPHLSIGNLTPEKLHQVNLHQVNLHQVNLHQPTIKTERLWKNYYNPSRKQTQRQTQRQTCPPG